MMAKDYNYRWSFLNPGLAIDRGARTTNTLEKTNLWKGFEHTHSHPLLLQSFIGLYWGTDSDRGRESPELLYTRSLDPFYFSNSVESQMRPLSSIDLEEEERGGERDFFKKREGFFFFFNLIYPTRGRTFRLDISVNAHFRRIRRLYGRHSSLIF